MIFPNDKPPSLPGLTEIVTESTPVNFYDNHSKCSTVTVECEDISRTLSCASFF